MAENQHFQTELYTHREIAMIRISQTIPILFLTGLASVLILSAKTDYLTPLMQFIHTDQVTSWQVFACILFSFAGLWLTFILLNIICKFYSNRIEDIPGNSAEVHLPPQQNMEVKQIKMGGRNNTFV